MIQPTCRNQFVPQLSKTYRPTNCLSYASSLALALLFVIVAPLRAADVTWTNGSGSFKWNLSDPNWSTGAWNNGNADAAIFDATGAGAINVTSPINVDSINLLASGYSLNGTGPLTFVNGSNTLVTGTINVDTHFEFTINTPINSSLGLSKKAPGTLQLAGPITFSGLGLPLHYRHEHPLRSTFTRQAFRWTIAVRLQWDYADHEYRRPARDHAPRGWQWSV